MRKSANPGEPRHAPLHLLIGYRRLWRRILMRTLIMLIRVMRLCRPRIKILIRIKSRGEAKEAKFIKLASLAERLRDQSI